MAGDKVQLGAEPRPVRAVARHLPQQLRRMPEILQRFNEDLTALQRAIRWGEGDKLRELFTRTHAIRRSIIEPKQA